jgi:protein gp37/ParB-like chromosome segregation protein Spo0J
MSMFVANTYELEPHPACLILPDMDREDFEKLKEDISGFGLLHPIILYQGKILDGRHRYRACMELGIEPAFEDWQGGSAVVEYVLSENLLRRHLTASQKAMVATRAMEYHRAEAAKRQKESGKLGGAPTIKQRLTEESANVSPENLSATVALTETNVVDFPSDNGKAAATAAKEVGVSPRTIERAVYVKEHGTEQDVQEVEQGKSSVNAKAAEIKARTKPKPAVSEWITPAQWGELSDEDQQAALTKPTDKKFNKQDNASIDWAAWSWNPITGCDHGCDYCYARDIANRFYGELGFAPALHPDRLLIPGNHKDAGKQNNRVFTCSMADLFGAWVPKEWIDAVLAVCAETPAFDFLLLTKNPKRLTQFEFPRNCWVGTTTDTQRRMDIAERIFADVDASVKWVSVEPMLEPVMPSDPSIFQWYVIGGATPNANQHGFVPPFDWVFRLALAAHDSGAKSFIKTNFWNDGRPQGIPQESA